MVDEHDNPGGSFAEATRSRMGTGGTRDEAPEGANEPLASGRC